MPSRKAPLVSTPRTLREALYLLVEHSGMKVEAQAEQLGVHPSYLYNASNPHREHDGPHYQARLLVPHVRCTGNFVALDWIEQQLGRVAILLPAPRGGRAFHVHQGMLALTKELGQAAAAIERALSKDGPDGVALTDDELAACRKELFDVCTAAVAEIRALELEVVHEH